MLYITGDTHAIQIQRLSFANFPMGKTLTKDDIVFIAGDFGLVWHTPDSRDYLKQERLIEWLSEKPWTTVFVDGNHENHELLANLEVVKKFGGKMGKVNDSIFHAKRGEIYTIDGKKIFTMGGAVSIDKVYRKEGIDWWPGENISGADIDNAFRNLDRHGWLVDYVITHTCCQSVLFEYVTDKGHVIYNYDRSIENFLEHISEKLDFKIWYFGHMHDDLVLREGKFRMLYEDVVELGDVTNLTKRE